ncbi:orotate phosphoribosyltransferase [candidate division KSB1 bacterium 4484_188]|nr:MAG: orotate phosphoribosyltransferase [candidate division KSB1 bacterium 4484_188]
MEANIEEQKGMELSQDIRLWAMLCHLIALAGFVIPFGNIIGPLVVWMIKREESPFIDYHGKEALNFQISMSIYIIAAAILVLIAIGILLLVALGIFGLIMIVIASMKANSHPLF